MTAWKIEGFEDGQILVAFERDGVTRRVNVNVAHVVDQVIAPPGQAPVVVPVVVPVVAAAADPTAPRVVGFLYRFEVDNVLSAHRHDAATLHDIRVLSGRVLVRKTSGDVEAGAGETVAIGVGEDHSVEGIGPAETLHVLLS